MEKKRKVPSKFRRYEVKGTDIYGNPSILFVVWKMFLYQVHKTFPKAKVKRVS
ncbi:MAG: hypothetical protein ACD_12C00664G0006 [uncultured bacterium]|nr:MAG: hypothetical protein ACD_12C00664G0006 [uncultured bacterium]